MRRPILSSFFTRVVGLFVLLLLVTQGGGFLLINAAVLKNAEKIIRNELGTGQRIFNRLLDHNSQGLAEAASIVAADFAFRKAIATHDRTTIVSVLENHGARINAKLMMLVGLDNTLIADMQRPDETGQAFPFPDLTAAAEREGNSTTAIELVGDQAYQFVIVPVRAPLPIAWVVMGFLLDDKFAADLKALSALDISFVAQTRNSEWRILATTLPAASLDDVRSAIGKLDLGAGDGDETSFFRGQNYDNRALPIKQSSECAIAAVLHLSLEEALEPANRLRTTLFWLTLILLPPSVLLAMLLARSVTKPLSTLAQVASGIARGDYSQEVAINRRDEIGELSYAFDSMRQGIDAREKQILKLAFRDPLTNLPNRTLFKDRLQQALALTDRERQPLAIMLMDLDRFKEVNKTLGHNLGDQLLQEVAERLCRAFHRKSDTVARLGGDEFAILLPACTCMAAQKRISNLLPSLEQPATIKRYRVDVGLSIGIAGFPAHGTDANSLMRNADIAMYMAKNHHTGVVIHDPQHDSSTAYNLSIVGDMRQALQRDEFVLYYQPKVRLAGRHVDCVEALIRWIHPERGFIAPDLFIPLAEQTGKIRAITRWVLDKALKQNALWRAAGIELAVAVNASARDLEDGEFPDVVAQLLEQHRTSPRYLTLEITESVLMEDPEHAMETIHRLDKLGVKLAIDDYGSGYSSLSYIKRLPVAELKIDKSFVMGMANDPDDALIVRSTVDLGHNMGLSVVAEGVENAEVWDILHGMGCDLAQGYYMSKPLEPAELERWLRTSPVPVLQTSN